MLKLSENPPIVWPAATLSELRGEWWAAHTKARNEKALANDLSRDGIAYFLPLVKRAVFSGNRKRIAMIPLFPSYLFFCGDGDDRYRALTTNRICRTLRVKDQYKLIRELCAIETALAHDAPLVPHPLPAEGQLCRITRGTFAGLEGIVISRKSKARVVLQVSFISQGASMEVDPDIIEVVDT